MHVRRNTPLSNYLPKDAARLHKGRKWKLTLDFSYVVTVTCLECNQILFLYTTKIEFKLRETLFGFTLYMIKRFYDNGVFNSHVFF